MHMTRWEEGRREAVVREIMPGRGAEGEVWGCRSMACIDWFLIGIY